MVEYKPRHIDPSDLLFTEMQMHLLSRLIRHALETAIAEGNSYAHWLYGDGKKSTFDLCFEISVEAQKQLWATLHRINFKAPMCYRCGSINHNMGECPYSDADCRIDRDNDAALAAYRRILGPDEGTPENGRGDER